MQACGNQPATTPLDARPLKRVIQRALQNPLATMILEGRINDGETVTVSAGEGGLTLNGVKAEAA
jgi:ATP-dependent Clp protease ATP-binding subunit ClpB